MAATKLTDKLTNIADAIREKTGGTDALTLDGMVEAIEGIQAGGDTSIEDGLVTRSLTEYSNSRVTSIGSYAFSNCLNLTTADFPLVTSIGNYAFYSCSKLTTADVPAVTSIGSNAFYSCSKLTTADFPLVTSIGNYAFSNCLNLTTADFPLVTSIGSNAFQYCSKLTTADVPAVTSIGSNAFSYCYNLTSLILRSEKVCTLTNKNAFNSCYHILGTVNSTYNPEGLKDGYIYVPDALVEDYKAATNWSTYASQIKPLSEYVEVG